MARIDKGEALTSLKLQPGATLAVSRYGVLRGTARYRCDYNEAGELWPAFGVAHPRSSVCRLVDCTLTDLELNISEFACEYLGISLDPTTPEIEFLGGLDQENIITHPRWETHIGGTAAAPLNGAVYDDEGNFLFFPPDATLDLGGVDSYLVPACVARVTIYSSDYNDELTELGERKTPPAGIPDPPSGRDWLMTSWARKDFGHVYQFTYDLTASGLKGWNPVIYKPYAS